MELKDFFTIGISLLALFISSYNFLKEKRKSKNYLIRLIVLVKSLERDFDSLNFNHRMCNFIPGTKNDPYEKAFLEKNAEINKKINAIYELLMFNHIISETDTKVVFENLNNIEEQLFELMNLSIDTAGDMEIVLSIINPLKKYREIVERVVLEYEKV